MTTEPVALETLLSVRSRLMEELPRRLTEKRRRFLLWPVRAEPNWSLLRCPHASDLPELRWKLTNLATFEKNRAADFNRQVEMLMAKLQG